MYWLTTRTVYLDVANNIKKTTIYTYRNETVNGVKVTGTQIATETTDGVTTSYEYDAVGNIKKVSKNNAVYEEYTYDALNQLTGVVHYNTDGTTDTYIYEYDDTNLTKTIKNGTVILENTYEDTTWKHRVTKVNGQMLSYDEIGNPTFYYKKTFQWSNGRRLVSSGTTSFTYNVDGTRLTKTNANSDTTTTYQYAGGVLYGEQINNSRRIYLYDEKGSVYGYIYNYDTYYFEKNIQGDVIGIWNKSGDKIASYTYDAWGNVLSIVDQYGNSISDRPTHQGNLNPIRYRGYYYDTEIGLYYVSSRYYDPEIGRWINTDNNFSNYNLFMYCGNNPVNRIDPNGEHWYYLWIDDLIEAVDELMASVSNIVYGRAAYERSYYDPRGANDLWNSRPFQDTKPSQEMQIFTEFMYDHDFVADISVSASIPNTKINVKVGASKVLSPNKNINASYVHAGIGSSTPSVLPINISYSVGIVNGVKTKENYAKHFLDIGAGAIFGFDYCFWPNGASAYSFTLGTSYGVYGGYDYYWCLD